MSLYFFTRVQLDARPMPDPGLTRPHPKLPMGVVGSSSGKAIICSADGEQLGVASRQQSLGAVAWHDEDPVLAVGWKSGEVTLWRQGADPTTLMVKEGCAVTAVAWGGSVCAVAMVQRDAAAAAQHFVAALALDNRGLAPLFTCAVDGAVAGLVPLSGASDSSEVCMLLYGPGNVMWALDDSQHAAPLVKLEAGVSPTGALWDAATRRLVVYTSTHSLHAYTVDHTLRSAELLERKISVAVGADPTLTRMVWAAPGVVALTAGDETVRFFDVAQDQTTLLALPPVEQAEGGGGGATAPAPGDDVIVGMSACRRKNLICAITRSGRFAVWALDIQQATESGGELAWHVTASLRSDERTPVEHGAFFAEGAVLAVHQEAVTVLQETPRLRRWGAGGASAVQVASNTVLVRTSAGDKVVLKNHSRVKALDIALPQVALFTGKQLEIHSVTGTATRQMHTIEQASPVIGIHQDGIIAFRGGKITYMNYQQHAMQSVGFAETEGEPVLMDIHGDFVAVVTDANMIKCCRVSLRDLTVEGPTRDLTKDVIVGENTDGRRNRRESDLEPSDSGALGPGGPLPGTVAAPPAAKKRGFGSPGPAGAGRAAMDADARKAVVTVARVNGTGRLVAFLCRAAGSAQNLPAVWVYDLAHDQTAQYEFVDNKVPVDIAWNRPEVVPASAQAAETEALMFAVETRSAKLPAQAAADPAEAPQDPEQSLLTGAAGGGADRAERTVMTFFAAPGAVRYHSVVPIPRDGVCMVGVAIPNVWLATASGDASDYNIVPVRIRDFEGIATVGEPGRIASGASAAAEVKLREALVQFAYCTATGNMDEAFKAVKTVKDPAVWTNLGRMCVSTKRLDVAEVCLAYMNDAVAARALREARKEPEPGAALAALAVSLGMLDEAEKLLRRCRRHDLLTELFASCGKWDGALRHAEQHDRIRAHPVLFRHAQHLEAEGKVDEALKLYEKARCFGTEGPRLLFVNQRLDELRARAEKAAQSMQAVNEAAVSQSPVVAAPARSSDGFLGPKKDSAAVQSDRELTLWWAQYLDSIGDSKAALDFYTKARDGFNAVRMLTSMAEPDLDRAQEIVTDPHWPSAKGAAYFIARHYENKGEFQDALKYYELAGAFKNGLRLARDNDLVGDTVAFALKCDDRHVALETAAFFEQRGLFDKAAQLYQKGGDTQRAIDVCIKGRMYEELHHISENLDAATADPETYIAMAEHFITSGHFERAVQMLVFGKAFNEALQLCLDKAVPLSPAMAEAMTLPKSDNAEDEEYRIALLKRIAKVAKAQESWHLACKKYTQAGEHSKAMKVLLRSGDTEKIIFFANHSRNQEIYIIAANYLQSQNWQQEAAIYKQIVVFYTKAKAFDNLASFYDACAQLQIDEFRDYDKALVTLREAQKALDRGDAARTKKDELRVRVVLVERFVDARRLIKPGEPCPQMEDACSDLLLRQNPSHVEHAALEGSVRVGDIYALLVEYHDKLGQTDKAFALIERMQDAGIELTFFLEAALVDRICQAVGRDPAALTAKAGQGASRDDVDDEVGFQVDEEV